MLKIRSKVVRKILAHFFAKPERKHYFRQLARYLKVDVGNLWRALRKLEAEGLFKSEREGRFKFFFLNKKHPFYGEYRKIFLKSFSPKTKFKKTSQRFKTKVLGLFKKKKSPRKLF